MWWPVAIFAVVWAAVLIPSVRRRDSPRASVEDFERRMELLAHTEAGDGRGRWIVTPRKGMRFLGPGERGRVRAQERRRRVFVLLLEAIGFTFLIGLVPPLRDVWKATAGLVGLLVVYVWLLVAIKQREQALRVAKADPAAARAPRVATRPAVQRYVAEGSGRLARPTFNGLGSLGEGDLVHVVVRRSERVGVAGA